MFALATASLAGFLPPHATRLGRAPARASHLAPAVSLAHPLPCSLQPSSRRASLQMLDNPVSAVVAPLRKFEPGNGAASTGDLLSDLPIEVVLLFGAIFLVGVIGLVKQSGALGDSAPTVGLGDSREDLLSSAEEAKEEEDMLSQAEKEKKYFSILAEEAKNKRGGSAKRRKKRK